MQRFRHKGIHSIIIYKSQDQEPIYIPFCWAFEERVMQPLQLLEVYSPNFMTWQKLMMKRT